MVAASRGPPDDDEPCWSALLARQPGSGCSSELEGAAFTTCARTGGLRPLKPAAAAATVEGGRASTGGTSAAVEGSSAEEEEVPSREADGGRRADEGAEGGDAVSDCEGLSARGERGQPLAGVHEAAMSGESGACVGAAARSKKLR